MTQADIASPKEPDFPWSLSSELPWCFHWCGEEHPVKRIDHVEDRVEMETWCGVMEGPDPQKNVQQGLLCRAIPSCYQCVKAMNEAGVNVIHVGEALAAKKRIAELEKEIERLTSLSVITAEVVDGGAEFELQGALVPHLGNILGKWFLDMEAKNYIEAKLEEVGPPVKVQMEAYAGKKVGLLVLTVQRMQGETPHEISQRAQKKLKEYKRVTDEFKKLIALLTNKAYMGKNTPPPIGQMAEKMRWELEQLPDVE